MTSGIVVCGLGRKMNFEEDETDMRCDSEKNNVAICFLLEISLSTEIR